MNLRHALPVLLLLAPAPAMAQEFDLGEQVARCAAMKDTIRRLSCYDWVASKAPKPQPAQEAKPEQPAEPAPAATPGTPTAEPAKATPPAPPAPIKEQKSLRELGPKTLAEVVAQVRNDGSTPRYEAEGALVLTYKSSELVRR